MEQSLEKFLDFNGKKIYFQSADGIWWIAIKPICEALGVDYINQFKSLKRHRFFNQLLSEQTIVAADGRMRKMMCLEECFPNLTRTEIREKLQVWYAQKKKAEIVKEKLNSYKVRKAV